MTIWVASTRLISAMLPDARVKYGGDSPNETYTCTSAGTRPRPWRIVIVWSDAIGKNPLDHDAPLDQTPASFGGPASGVYSALPPVVVGHPAPTAQAAAASVRLAHQLRRILRMVGENE